MKTLIVDDEDGRQMPTDTIYIGTAMINRETQSFKIQSATVTNMQPHPEVHKMHPDLFNNSFLVIKEFQKDQGCDGYPLGNAVFYHVVPGNVLKLGRVEYVVL